MSYASVYAKKPPNAKGIGLTIGLHIAITAGILALPAITVVIKDRGHVKTIHIPIKPEPTPPKAKPLDPIVAIPAINKPQAPIRPIVERPIYADPPNYGLEGSGDGFLSGGAGAGIEELPFDAIKIAPDPIIIEAKLNTRYSRQFQPSYPSGQLRLGEEGVVSVRVLVGANGRAKRLELISTPHRDFWNSTRRHALKKWRFKPATKDGKAYESWITLRVRFTINS